MNTRRTGRVITALAFAALAFASCSNSDSSTNSSSDELPDIDAFFDERYDLFEVPSPAAPAASPAWVVSEPASVDEETVPGGSAKIEIYVPPTVEEP